MAKRKKNRGPKGMHCTHKVWTTVNGHKRHVCKGEGAFLGTYKKAKKSKKSKKRSK